MHRLYLFHNLKEDGKLRGRFMQNSRRHLGSSRLRAAGRSPPGGDGRVCLHGVSANTWPSEFIKLQRRWVTSDVAMTTTATTKHVTAWDKYLRGDSDQRIRNISRGADCRMKCSSSPPWRIRRKLNTFGLSLLAQVFCHFCGEYAR